MLIKYGIARVQPPGLFGGVLHVTLVTANTAAAGATVASPWTMLLLKRLLWSSWFSNLICSRTAISRIVRSHCRNVDIAFEAVKSVFHQANSG